MDFGKIKTMQIVRLKEFGAYLAEHEDSEESVLLPKKQVPENAKPGDVLDVFLYKDSADRPIATTKKPLLTAGEVGKLRIQEVTKIGAFLDIGLERDVLLPFRERAGELKPGETVLAALYVDKSNRLAATMRIYPYLKTAEGIVEDEEVTGTVYEIRDMGIFVAVRDRYFGFIPRPEAYGTYKIGEEISARVTRIRTDGKLDLSPRKKSYLQIYEDADRIFLALKQAGGQLPYGDKSDPGEIRSVFGMSKSAYKRALGHLLKEDKILVTDEGIQSR